MKSALEPYRGANPDLDTTEPVVPEGDLASKEVFSYDASVGNSPKAISSPSSDNESRMSLPSVLSMPKLYDAGVADPIGTTDLGESPDQYPSEEIPKIVNDQKSRSFSITQIDPEKNADVYGLLLALQTAHRSVMECQKELHLSVDEFQAYRQYAEGRIAELESTVQKLRFQKDIQSSLDRQEKLQNISVLNQAFIRIRLDLDTLKESVLVCGDFFTLSLKKLGYRINEALLREAKISLKKRTPRIPQKDPNPNLHLGPKLDRVSFRQYLDKMNTTLSIRK